MGENDQGSRALLLHQSNEVRLHTLREQDDSPKDGLRRLVCLGRELDGADVADRRLVRAQDLRIPQLCQDVVLSPPQKVERFPTLGFLEYEVVVSQVSV